MHIPNASSVSRLKTIYYSDETNIAAAKHYASELYSYYLEEDDSEQMLSIVKREFEHLHFTFPSDKEIAVYLASCISAWAFGKKKSTLTKVKKELLIMRANFPKSEDIAEYYSDVLVFLSREEQSIETCNVYLQELCELKNCFCQNDTISGNYDEMKDKIDDLNDYWECFCEAEKCKEQYNINPCLNTAKKFAESLCELSYYEINEEKCGEYVKIIEALVKDNPASIELIEFQASAIYYLAVLQGYDAMRKSEGVLSSMLNKYPSNERLAEIYTQTLDYLCEDEDNLEILVRKIEKYYLLYPNNLSITTSYATVLSVIIEEQSAGKRKETLDFLWNLFLQHSDEELFCLYKDAFNRFQYAKDEESNRRAFLHDYSNILKQNVLQIDCSTGEVVGQFSTLIEACKRNRLSPQELICLVEEKQNSAFEWVIIKE